MWCPDIVQQLACFLQLPLLKHQSCIQELKNQLIASTANCVKLPGMVSSFNNLIIYSQIALAFSRTAIAVVNPLSFGPAAEVITLSQGLNQQYGTRA
jgi:hypothetical protein